jgi:hypothetical protein
MQFNARQIGHFEHFREKRADMVEMSKYAFGAVVTFAAENFIAVDTEPVEKIPLSFTVFSTNRGRIVLTVSSFPGCTLRSG